MLVMLAILIDEPFLRAAAEVEKGQSGLPGITATPPSCHPTLVLHKLLLQNHPYTATTNRSSTTTFSTSNAFTRGYLLRHNFEVFW